jgi:hypothetical protein
MNNRTKHIAVLGLFLGWFLSGCSKSVLEPATPVPSECQKFLDKYFDAVKSKDVEKIRAFSSYVPAADSKGEPKASVDMMRETKGKFAADGFELMIKTLGDFKSYSVVSAKETTITTAELAAKKMQGTRLEGIHAEIICKAKFSNKESVQISLNLFKENQDSEYFVEAWNYRVGL